MNNLVASIIICTYNRADALAQTLESMAAVGVPAHLPTELIVVDNGSTDDTRQVACSFQSRKLAVRYIQEPRQGQCFARNAGLAAARGEIILFTDDDVRPPKAWLTGMCGAILSGQADAVQGGVKIAPYLQRDWMQPGHHIFCADTTLWDKSEVRSFIGANMAFSKQVLSDVPAFDTELGPGALGFMDDSLFYYQLIAVGRKVLPMYDVCVEHHFDASRLSRVSLLASCVKLGRSSAYLTHHWEHEDMPDARKRLARAYLRLAYYRKWRGEKWTHLEGASEWEMWQVLEIAQLRQFLRERTRSRNYTRHGLVKLNGLLRK